MKWIFYVIVFIYMYYRTVYGLKLQKETKSLLVEPIDYGANKNYYDAGIRKSIICKSTNKKQKVEWFSPSGKVVPRTATNRVFTQEHFVSAFRTRVPAMVLVLTRALFEDTGVWECRSGDVRHNVSLCVIDHSEFVDTSTEVTVDRGRSITLSCEARGEPEPRIVWHRNGEIISDNLDSSKYEIMTWFRPQGFVGLLTIKSLEPEDSGIYNCEAVQESPLIENCIASNNLNISLLVNYAPQFADNDTTIVYWKENESLELICAADAYPTPTYRWFREDADILSEYPKDDIKLVENGEIAVLTLQPNETVFGQRYVCRSNNRYGEIDKTFAVMKMERPTKPSEIILENASHDALQLQVKWDDEVLFPVDEFFIQYMKTKSTLKKRVGTSEDWNKAEEVLIKSDEHDVMDGDNSGILITLPKLEEETKYKVRVRATNEAGDSPWSEPITASTIVKPEDEIPEEVSNDEEEGGDNEQPEAAAQISDGTFYGIFFAAGIVVCAIGCMFFMRMV